MIDYKKKYPTQRYLKFEKIVRVKEEGGYFHIPEVITSPQEAADTIHSVMNIEQETQEIFGVICLNTKNRVIGIEPVHRGTLNASIVHPRDVLKMALMKNAACIMVYHNHPSGNTNPSREDIAVTNRLKEAGEIIGIELLDHIILGEDGAYRSLRESGHL